MATTFLTLLAAIGLFPFVFMFFTSFKTNEQFYNFYFFPTLPLHFDNYANAWYQISPYFITSLIVAAASVLGAVIVGSLSAYVLSRFTFPGRTFFFVVIGLLMAVPHVTSLIPLFVLVSRLGLLNTRIVLILPHLTGGAVLSTMVLVVFMRQIPQEIFDAARVDGAGSVRLYWRILMPLSLPAIGSVSLLITMGVWNDYFWPLLTITDNELRTIPVGLEFFQGQNATQWGPLFAGYTLASLPLLVVFFALSKYYLKGIVGGFQDR